MYFDSVQHGKSPLLKGNLSNHLFFFLGAMASIAVEVPEGRLILNLDSMSGAEVRMDSQNPLHIQWKSKMSMRNLKLN